MQENIIHPQPYLRVFPDPANVFAEPVEKYARHLMPLVSIDLSQVNPEWQGWIHIVNPCEPEDGCIGEWTQPHHTYYCRSNWIGFHLNADNKYELLADWRYFLLEGEDGAQYTDLLEHYERQHRVYAAAKADFAEQGLLYAPYFLDSSNRYSFGERPDEPTALLEQLGGQTEWGNWSSTSDMPVDDSDEDNVFPVSPDGKPFQFIAAVPAYHYCASGADWILLFFESESRTALLTFDWT